MTRNALMAVCSAMIIALLAGCNTVHGFGKDIESGGKAIERASGTGH